MDNPEHVQEEEKENAKEQLKEEADADTFKDGTTLYHKANFSEAEWSLLTMPFPSTELNYFIYKDRTGTSHVKHVALFRTMIYLDIKGRRQEQASQQ